jgi:hypothetical protein
LVAKNGKGQVSIELIIIIAAVLAVALILVVQLQKTAGKGSEVVGKESDSALRQVGSMISCQTADDCPTDFSCNPDTRKCESIR